MMAEGFLVVDPGALPKQLPPFYFPLVYLILPCNTKRWVTFFGHNIDSYKMTIYLLMWIVGHVLRICVSPGQHNMGMEQRRCVGDIPEPKLQVEEPGSKLN